MTRIMLAALAAAIATSAAAAERRYTVTSFDRVEVEGPYQVTLSTGRSSAATATGSNEAIERLSIDVQGRTLRIRPNRSAWGGYPGKDVGPVKIALGTHDLRAVSLAGSGSLSIDKARAMRFDVAVSGSGRIGIANIEADNLLVGLLGSGKILIGGKTKQLRATVRGSGDFEGEELKAEDVEIGADTTGSIVVAARRTAKVTSTGAGDTRIVGKPACTAKALGSGRILCGN